MAQTSRSGRSGRRSPVLWVLVGVLVVVAIGAAKELQARREAERAFATLQAVIDSAPGWEPEAVQARLGARPVKAYRTEDHRWIEVYRWDGVLQPYTVYAVYRSGATRLLLSVAKNRPPDGP